MSFDWKKVVGAVAPTIATALGGPLAGLAVRAVGEAVLGDGAASEDDVARALASASPEDMLKLKAAEQAFAVKMRELDVDLAKMGADDRDSARKREMTVGGMANPMLATLIIGGFLTMTAYLLRFGLPGTVDAALAGTLVGYVSAKAEQVVAYYFGSSMGSAEKTRHLAALGGAK